MSLACLVLASLCAPVAVAQDVGAEEPGSKPETKVPVIQIKPQDLRQILPPATVSVATYLPSAAGLNKVQIDERLRRGIESVGDPMDAMPEAAAGGCRTGNV